MCSVQGGVQLIKDGAGLIVAPLRILNPFAEDDDSSDSDDENESPEYPMAKTTLPQTIWFDAPADAKPGDTQLVQGPHGPIRVVLPEGVVPGKPTSSRLGPPESYTVSVPQGCATGEKVSFTGAMGERLCAFVPPGVQEGDQFQVTPPVVLIQVPAGVQGGSTVSYRSPNTDQVLLAIVPNGLKPGQYFCGLYTPTATITAREEATVQHQFVVWLDKTHSNQLGLRLDTEGAHLCVLEVLEGAASQWNRSQTPMRQLQGGDRIVKVNGVTGAAAMFVQCREQTAVEMTVQRMSGNTTEIICSPVVAPKVEAYVPRTMSMDSSPTQHQKEVGQLTTVSSPTHPASNSKAPDPVIPPDLDGMKKSDLKQLSESLGATQQQIDEALDAESPKQALISLIRSRSPSSPQDELEKKSVSGLRQIMQQLGVSEKEMDTALDADFPKQACIQLIKARSAVKEDYSSKPMSELRQLMKQLGASTEEMDEALDANDQRQACINIITTRQKNQGNQRESLEKEKISELRKKAAAAGSTEAQIDTAINSEDVKSKLIDLILG